MLTTKANPLSSTPKSILGITQIITKAYQVTKFNLNILICTISMADILPNPKGQTFYLNIVLRFFLNNLIRDLTSFRKIV